MRFTMQINDEDEELEFSPLSIENAEDRMILMHRDAHFGGNFEQMLSYYKSGGKGVNPEIEIKRIQELAQIERETQRNLASQLLSSIDIEQIKTIRNVYIALRELYELPKSQNQYPRLLADLILSEEENPITEIDAIVAEKSKIVPELLVLLNSDNFANPLFPGYGQAPGLAARCLARIGDRRAMISLFEAIGESDVLAEEHLLDGLKAIGEPAKQFLLKVLQGKPIDRDNERAAIALVSFKDDPEVASTALKMLCDPAAFADAFFANYLILICEGLQKREERERFALLTKEPAFPSHLTFDHAYIEKQWSD